MVNGYGYGGQNQPPLPVGRFSKNLHMVSHTGELSDTHEFLRNLPACEDCEDCEDLCPANTALVNAGELFTSDAISQFNQWGSPKPTYATV